MHFFANFSGGGKDLATAAAIATVKDEKPLNLPPNPDTKTPGAITGK